MEIVNEVHLLIIELPEIQDFIHRGLNHVSAIWAMVAIVFKNSEMALGIFNDHIDD